MTRCSSSGRLAQLAVLAVLAIGMAACTGDDGSGDSATGGSNVGDTSDAVDESDDGVLAGRFDAVRVRVVDADGVACGLCMWRAADDDDRRQGLMGVTDLEGAAGMVFVFEAPSQGGFWMKDTLIPLDVAYYDESGSFLAADAMQPCAEGTDCPVYAGATDYTLAIEVPAGLAAVYGMEPGGRAIIDGPCDPASAPVPTLAPTSTTSPT